MKSERMWVLLHATERILYIADRRSACISWAEKVRNQRPWRKLRKELGWSVVRCTVTYGEA